MAFATSNATVVIADGAGNRNVDRRTVDGYTESRIAVIYLHGAGSSRTGAANRLPAHPDHVDYFPDAQSIDIGGGAETRWATIEDGLQNSAYAAIDTDRDLDLISAISAHAQANGAKWVFVMGHSSGAKMASSVLSNFDTLTSPVHGVCIRNRGTLNTWAPRIPWPCPVVLSYGTGDPAATRRHNSDDATEPRPSANYVESIAIFKFAMRASDSEVFTSGNGFPIRLYDTEDNAQQRTQVNCTLERFTDAPLDILTDEKGHTFSNDANYQIGSIAFELLRQRSGAKVAL